MAKEIRATGLSDEICKRWEVVSALLGGTTNAQNMTVAIDILYLMFCSSQWADIQRKAATLITAQWADRGGSIVPMHPSEVKRVSMDGSGVSVFTKGQGEPYPIKREVWEQG